MKRIPIISLLLLLTGIGLTGLLRFNYPVSAEDFRMETDVFAGSGEVTPIVETLTLFHGHEIFDFMGSNGEEITILNMRDGFLVLLDTQRQIKTTITTNQLMAFASAIRARPAPAQRNSLLAPRFQETYDPATQVLTLSDVQLTYRVQAIKPDHPDRAQKFHLFADWYARLNATRIGNPPPFGRIQLNQSLANHGLLPAEIERSVGTADRQQKMRSHHLTNWKLTETDHQRIRRARKHVTNFQEVTPEQYWHSHRMDSEARTTD